MVIKVRIVLIQNRENICVSRRFIPRKYSLENFSYKIILLKRTKWKRASRRSRKRDSISKIYILYVFERTKRKISDSEEDESLCLSPP